jgi:pyruvate formate lyase activating enzyme
MTLHEAMLYKQLPENRVGCILCARLCTIPEGRVGFCLVRKNEKGKLYALSYGKACSACVDPITKKPLSHFHPGSCQSPQEGATSVANFATTG